MPFSLQAILIGGTSHVGKSTLADRLAERLGWARLSTDGLGRHPGRPWQDAPAPVLEFYERLSPETIHWFLGVHHENMWRQLRPMIEAERAAGRPFVLEGAALRPAFVAPLLTTQVFGVLLHAPDAFLVERMRTAAAYETRGAAERVPIDAFIDRSLRENAALLAEAQEVGLRVVDASDAQAVADLVDELASRATVPPIPGPLTPPR
ncbi:AAA family ATPase [Pleomorphomonas sp. JP5]|uniref:AAA family ATPase n=1 Tax=Pleomorphomonas sp. JP5 TaxID=2942998 RepID=UPI0020444E54|nr:AAA family ATPase [Pleomorphomonas sp. JP5]MCM5557569.1 AAA family ATPase [Pleomorphomonas sp. JP5]